MTQFMKKTFTVHAGQSEAYRENWAAVFRKKEKPVAKKKSKSKGTKKPGC